MKILTYSDSPDFISSPDTIDDVSNQILSLHNWMTNNNPSFSCSTFSSSSSAGATVALRQIATRFGAQLSTLLPSLWTANWDAIRKFASPPEKVEGAEVVTSAVEVVVASRNGSSSSAPSSVSDVVGALKTLETVVPSLHPVMIKEVLSLLPLLVGSDFMGRRACTRHVLEFRSDQILRTSNGQVVYLPLSHSLSFSRRFPTHLPRGNRFSIPRSTIPSVSFPRRHRFLHIIIFINPFVVYAFVFFGGRRYDREGTSPS